MFGSLLPIPPCATQEVPLRKKDRAILGAIKTIDQVFEQALSRPPSGCNNPVSRALSFHSPSFAELFSSASRSAIAKESENRPGRIGRDGPEDLDVPRLAVRQVRQGREVVVGQADVLHQQPAVQGTLLAPPEINDM